MNRIEDKFEKLSDTVDKIDLQINTSLPPKQGIFYNGQMFDAYKFVLDLINTAKRKIVLIDNYIDQTTLSLFSQCKGIEVTIYTKQIPKKLELDLAKFALQYFPVALKIFKHSHDRFLIIDNTIVFHFGASLKDLGKKWFAFSKMEMDAQEIVAKLGK